MPDIYGVLPADVAKELPGMFPGGFTTTTKPTSTDVVGFITTADALVAARIARVTGAPASGAGSTAIFAKRYIVDTVKAAVIRVVYTGNNPTEVEAAAAPFERLAKLMLEQIDALQATPPSRGIGWASVPSGTTVNVASW